jgi:type IV secretory pathway TrbL component
MLFNYSCVSVRTFVWKFVWLFLMSCIYCRTTCVISLEVCVSESMCMNVCMIVCCPVYIFVRLMLVRYRCVSVRACVWKFVWLCVVLYILSYVLCYFTIGVCQRRTTIYTGQHTIIQSLIHMISLTHTYNEIT